MSWLSRLANVLRASRIDRELDEEQRFHLESRIDALVEQGLSRTAAEAEAARRFGNRLLLREESRDVKMLARAQSILQDVAFGLRLCRKNAILTGAAIASLSLAIGACTAAFSLIDALILRPLPVNDPGRLVYGVYVSPPSPDDDPSFNYPLFERMRVASGEQVQLFAMSFQSRRDAVFDDASPRTEKIYAQWISGTAFPILGVRPQLGRLLTESDDRKPGQHPVAVLSYDFWSRRFGRDPSVLGRWVTIRGTRLQIVGVAEKTFTGAEPGIMTDLWAPTMMWDNESLIQPGWEWFRLWGRLRPGVGADRAQATLQTVFTAFRRERASVLPADEPRDRVERFIHAPLYLRSAANGPSNLRQRFARPLWVLGIVAGLVLLVACANVAGLLTARTAAREREMALRLAIGAGRGRLIQQMLIESAILSIASCITGAFIAAYACPLLVRMLSTSASVVRFDLHPDLRVLAFLAAAGSATTLLFGLAPALRVSAVSPGSGLTSETSRHTTRVGLFRPLVAAQTGFSFLVLFVAGLFLTSFARLIRTDLGFDPAGVVVINMNAKETHDTRDEASPRWRQLMDRITELPGVRSTSFSAWSLLEGWSSTVPVRIPGRPVDPLTPFVLSVAPRFLETMRIPLLEGRDFDWSDWQPAAPSTAIVNESFARRYFPGESALGKRFFVAEKGNVLDAWDIIGVAADAKYRTVREAASPTIYASARGERDGAILVRSSMESRAAAAMLANELPRLHPDVTITGITTQSTLVGNTLVRERVLAVVSAFFSIVAIVLVAVGLYGVIGYGVVQRTREIGIRLALGARPLQIMRLVVSETGLMALAGVGLGLAGGIAASRWVTALLYEVNPSDAWSVAAPLACLLVACALSALAPALRATRVDPTTALRQD
jgi:putative ABC transport system permease protein